jgi:endonuclease YncB( thermonuclease family)
LVNLLGGAQGVERHGHVRVSGVTLRCLSFGSDRYERTVAACSLPDGRDVGCALLRAGVVLRWKRYGGSEVCVVPRRPA